MDVMRNSNLDTVRVYGYGWYHNEVLEEKEVNRGRSIDKMKMLFTLKCDSDSLIDMIVKSM